MKYNLKEVFKNKSGSEIIEALKVLGLVDNADLFSAIDASSIKYENLDDEDEIKETISDVFQRVYDRNKTKDSKKYQIVQGYFPKFSDIYKILNEWYSCGDYELMECVDNSTMIDYLDNTYEMEAHDSEVRSKYHHSVMKEIVETIYCSKIDLSIALEEYTSDELWQLFCNVFCCGYYDKERFDKGLEEFLKKLKSSNYNRE